MAVEVVTKEDLQVFRMQLINDIKQIILQQPQPAIKKWLKSTEVRRLLSISPGTLQNLRITGKLPFSKLGGIHYYRYEDVQEILNAEMNQNNS